MIHSSGERAWAAIESMGSFTDKIVQVGLLMILQKTGSPTSHQTTKKGPLSLLSKRNEELLVALTVKETATWKPSVIDIQGYTSPLWNRCRFSKKAFHRHKIVGDHIRLLQRLLE